MLGGQETKISHELLVLLCEACENIRWFDLCSCTLVICKSFDPQLFFDN